MSAVRPRFGGRCSRNWAQCPRASPNLAISSIIQTIIRNDKIEGLAIDRDLTKNDNFGGSVLWLSTSG